MVAVGIVGAAAIQFVATPEASAATSGRIRTFDNGYCLDANGDGGRGTNVILWPCQSGNRNQVWTWSGSALKNPRKGLCLDPGSSAGGWQGSSLILWTCNGGNNQNWNHNSDPGEFRNSQSGLVIDVPGSQYYRGATLIMWPSRGTNNQQFGYWDF